MPYWHSEVQDLMVGSRKILFHFEHWPTCQYIHVSTCFKPNIHQNGPKILGIKHVLFLTSSMEWKIFFQSLQNTSDVKLEIPMERML